MEKFKMPKWNFEIGDAIEPRSIVRKLFPACARQTDVRPMRTRAQDRGRARIPPEKIEETFQWRARSGRGRSCTFARRNEFAARMPDDAAAFIETKNSSRCIINR